MCGQDLNILKTYDTQCKKTTTHNSHFQTTSCLPESGGGILKDSVIKEFSSVVGNWRLKQH